jgi:hypothetical protein
MKYYKKISCILSDILKYKPNYVIGLIIQTWIIWVIPITLIGCGLYQYSYYCIPHRLEIYERQIMELRERNKELELQLELERKMKQGTPTQ